MKPHTVHASQPMQHAGIPAPLCGAVTSALAALRIGVHHRAVAETATNAASSRSHCLLTLHLEAREERVPGLAIMQRAKFTMVDLAGKAHGSPLHRGRACVSAWMDAASLSRMVHLGVQGVARLAVKSWHAYRTCHAVGCSSTLA